MKEPLFLQTQAYDHLINQIKNGTLRPNTIYSLNQMAKEIGVSRTPLRDAVLRLEQERYVDILPSKRFVLHKMTKGDIIETYQIRSAIEFYCFKQLSMNLSTPRGQEYFNKLALKVAQQKKIATTTRCPEEYGRKDYEFHRSVVQYVGNESMLDIYRRFMYRIFWLNVTSFSQEGRMDDTMTEHEQLLTFIETQDIDGLEKLMDHHLAIAQEINLNILDND